MSWILLAIIGHLANAAAFVIDKTLLSSTWKSSATYAALIGGMSAVVLLASPWVETWPTGRALISSAIFGGVFVLALWAFFEALSRAEASRVVPIVGSTIPILTLLGTATLLGEKLTTRIGLGFVCLLIATWILSRGSRRGKLGASTILVALLSATLFAVASVAGKDAFTQSSFLGVFVLSRGVAALVAVILGFSVQGARKELRSLFSPKKRSSAPPGSLGLTIVGQASGSLGFVLVNAAIAAGSAALVNALQAVQYATIVLVAWLGGTRLQKILKEDVSRQALILKGGAILLVGFGLWLVAG